MEINQIAPQTYTTESRAQVAKKQPEQELTNVVDRANMTRQAEAEAKQQAEQKAATKAAEERLQARPLTEMAKELQGLADSLGRSVQFTVNEESGDDIIMVFHKKTKELIRQIPSEEVVELRERLSKVFGSIIEEKI
jgi:flagellar protein FlaG